MARTCSGDLKQLWKIVRSGVKEVGGAPAATNFDRQLSNLATNMGVDLDKVFDSMTGEGFFSIQLSQVSTVSLPLGRSPLTIPQPSLLIGLAVKDDALVKALEAPLARNGLPVVKALSESVNISSLNMPIPLPFVLQPSFAVYSNYFLFGSSPQVVTDSIKSFRDKTGLAATPGFQKAFEGLPAANNGIVYMNPRFMNTIINVQTAVFQSAGEEGAAPDALRKLMGAQTNGQCALVIQNLRTGILTTGATSSSGKQMVSSIAMAPIGMLAGIAIPSFMKARSTAQENVCIRNLRMIEGAKEQWGLENNKKTGDPVDIEGISKYLPGGKLPVCPQGGNVQDQSDRHRCRVQHPGPQPLGLSGYAFTRLRQEASWLATGRNGGGDRGVALAKPGCPMADGAVALRSPAPWRGAESFTFTTTFRTGSGRVTATPGM